jgi:hypothetical protein
VISVRFDRRRWLRPSGAMKSRQYQHKVRLRGLRPRPRPRLRCGSIHVGASACPERMNSPLEQHEVRLRGLRRKPWCVVPTTVRERLSRFPELGILLPELNCHSERGAAPRASACSTLRRRLKNPAPHPPAHAGLHPAPDPAGAPDVLGHGAGQGHDEKVRSDVLQSAPPSSGRDHRSSRQRSVDRPRQSAKRTPHPVRRGMERAWRAGRERLR